MCSVFSLCFATIRPISIPLSLVDFCDQRVSQIRTSLLCMHMSRGPPLYIYILQVGSLTVLMSVAWRVHGQCGAGPGSQTGNGCGDLSEIVHSGSPGPWLNTRAGKYLRWSQPGGDHCTGGDRAKRSRNEGNASMGCSDTSVHSSGDFQTVNVCKRCKKLCCFVRLHTKWKGEFPAKNGCIRSSARSLFHLRNCSPKHFAKLLRKLCV